MRSRAGRPAAGFSAGALLAILLVSTVARSEGPGPVVWPIDTVEVLAARIDRSFSVERLPFFASVKNLEGASGRLLTIADVLEESAGVRVRRYGGLGAYAAASIRGSAPGQVEIYLDGVPLGSAEWGAVNLSELPVDNLVRAEIYRSGAPAALGASGLAGAVNLVTRPAGAPHTSLALTAGSYDTWKTYALRSGVLGDAAYLLSYRHVRTRGDFPFLYDPGTSVWNAADDTLLTRKNNAFREHALLGKLRLPTLRGWRFEVRDDWYLKESGLPGHGNLLYEEASFDNRRHRASLSAASPGLAGGRVRADFGAHHAYQKDRYSNPGKETALHLTDLIHRSETTGGRGLVTLRLFDGSEALRLQGDARRETFVPEDANPAVGKGFTRERRVSSLAAENEVLLLRGRVSFLGACRWTESEDNFHGTLPYAPEPEAADRPHRSAIRGPTLGARADLASFLTVRAGRARSGRLPTLFELFGTNGDVRPNPDLAPEEATTWDAGFRLRPPAGGPVSGFLDVSLYRARRDSLIVFIQNSQQSFKAVNLESAEAKGIEAQWEVRWGRARLDGSFTTQDVRQHGEVPHWDNRWVPYVSPREVFLRAALRAGPADLRVEYDFMDRFYRDRANTEEGRAPSRNVVSAGARVRLPGGPVTLDLDLQNIGDVRSEDAYGYPMPGRTVYVTVAYGVGGEKE